MCISFVTWWSFGKTVVKFIQFNIRAHMLHASCILKQQQPVWWIPKFDSFVIKLSPPRSTGPCHFFSSSCLFPFLNLSHVDGNIGIWSRTKWPTFVKPMRHCMRSETVIWRIKNYWFPFLLLPFEKRNEMEWHHRYHTKAASIGTCMWPCGVLNYFIWK